MSCETEFEGRWKENRKHGRGIKKLKTGRMEDQVSQCLALTSLNFSSEQNSVKEQITCTGLFLGSGKLVASVLKLNTKTKLNLE